MAAQHIDRAHNLLHVKHAGWGAFVDQCAKYDAWSETRTNHPDYSSVRNVTDASFYGTSTYADAIKLGRDGWPEGRAMMATALASVRALMTPDLVPGWRFDVAGERPDVARYLSGMPDCMVSPTEEENQQKPILSVLVEGWNSAYVSTSQMTRRGAAILAQIDALEAAGIRCELSIRFASSRAGDRHMRVAAGDFSRFVSDVPLKAADEHLEIDRLAFALVHPASLRRLHFREMECAHAKMASLAGGHGSPADAIARNYGLSADMRAIVIPSANDAAPAFQTDKGTADQVTRYFEEGLRQLGDLQCAGLADALAEQRQAIRSAA